MKLRWNVRRNDGRKSRACVSLPLLIALASVSCQQLESARNDVTARVPASQEKRPRRALMSPEWGPMPSETAGPVRACIDDVCKFKKIRRALARAKEGQTVRILPGVYNEAGVVRKNGVTVLAYDVHLFGKAANKKAAIIARGDDVVIEGLECSHIAVRDLNGACVRGAGRNLTLRQVYFHDAQVGLLTGRAEGRILIEDSRFERLGDPGGPANPHAIYVGDTADEFILRKSRVVSSSGEGHEVKSRAARTVIVDSVIASLDGDDSRLIDVSNGGDVIIRGNVLEEGPNSVNSQMIGIGLELRRKNRRKHEINRSLIENNLILVDRRGTSFLRSRDVPDPVIENNLFIGGPRLGRSDPNRWMSSRADAGLDDDPFLPSVGAAAARVIAAWRLSRKTL